MLDQADMMIVEADASVPAGRSGNVLQSVHQYLWNKSAKEASLIGLQ